MLGSALAFDTKFENGMISAGVKSTGGETEIEIPVDIDESKILQNSVVGRLELSVEIEMVKNQKLVVNGRKLTFTRQGDKIFTFVGRGGNAREWTLFDAEKREYYTIDSRGDEVRGYVVDVNEDEYVSWVGGAKSTPESKVKIENLKETNKKLNFGGRSYKVFEFENSYYTIQGKGGAACLWTHVEGNTYTRSATKGRKITAEMTDYTPSEGKPKPDTSRLPRVTAPAKKVFTPTYAWLTWVKLRF